MILTEVYIESLDEIDEINLSNKEVKTRKFAKHISLVITLIGYYLIMFPILFIVAMLDRKFISSIMMPIVEHGILKTTRFVMYQLVYFPCKLIFKLIG